MSEYVCMWGFPNIRGTILGVPIVRIILFQGLYWGPLILGKLPCVCLCVCVCLRFTLA